MHNKQQSKATRQVEVPSISGMLKQIAKDIRMPVLVLWQLNWEFEKRDADMVLFIHRPDAISTKVSEQQEHNLARGHAASLIVAKHRGGAVGEVSLRFWKGCTRFEEVVEGWYGGYKIFMADHTRHEGMAPLVLSLCYLVVLDDFQRVHAAIFSIIRHDY